MTRSSNYSPQRGTVAHEAPGEKPRGNVRERAVDQVRRFAGIFLYLFAFLGLFTLHEAIILEQNHIAFTRYGFALVNSLVLAKVMLVADDFHLGRRFEGNPLIYPIVFKSLAFPIVLIGFDVIEHISLGLFHGQGIVGSIPEYGGGGIKGLLSTGVILSVALIPLFAFSEISRVMGAGVLRRLIFNIRSEDVRIEVNLRSKPIEHAVSDMNP